MCIYSIKKRTYTVYVLNPANGFFFIFRAVSVAIHTDTFEPHPHLMVISAIWGEFVAHDVAHTPQMAGHLGQRLKCCNVDFDNFHPECYPIKIPEDDPFYGPFNVRCQEYAR